MFFEFSNDIVPILVCFTVYFSVITVHLANSIAKEYREQHRWKSQRDIQSELSLSLTEHAGTKVGLKQQNFLTRIVKRKEAPEEDGDYHFSSYPFFYKISRGGQRWKRYLYSHSLKNIVL